GYPCHPRLAQALHPPDLAWRSGHGGCGHAVPDRSPPAGRRAATGRTGSPGACRMKRILAALALVFVMLTPALAVSPDEVLDDPQLEQRARDISAGLRCLVCQNQSIDDSDADLARDLRILVRERLVEGDSNDEVEQYLVDRYGEFVLLNPRLSANTIVLWVAAPLLLAIGLIGIFVASRRQATPTPAGLTPEEAAALAALEDDTDKRS